jgi:hypothetical protein
MKWIGNAVPVKAQGEILDSVLDVFAVQKSGPRMRRELYITRIEDDQRHINRCPSDNSNSQKTSSSPHPSASHHPFLPYPP